MEKTKKFSDKKLIVKNRLKHKEFLCGSITDEVRIESNKEILFISVKEGRLIIKKEFRIYDIRIVI